MRVREIAETDGVSTGFVAKAAWLARVYPRADRLALGSQALVSLAPSHLEVAAKLEPEARRRLLQRAATERLPVRDVRRMARQQEGPSGLATTVGGADDLASAGRALELYARWPDSDLARLIAGPNGSTIHALAQAGQALAFRLERRLPKNCA